jgi:hypothetical protein
MNSGTSCRSWSAWLGLLAAVVSLAGALVGAVSNSERARPGTAGVTRDIRCDAAGRAPAAHWRPRKLSPGGAAGRARAGGVRRSTASHNMRPPPELFAGGCQVVVLAASVRDIELRDEVPVAEATQLGRRAAIGERESLIGCLTPVPGVSTSPTAPVRSTGPLVDKNGPRTLSDTAVAVRDIRQSSSISPDYSLSSKAEVPLKLAALGADAALRCGVAVGTDHSDQSRFLRNPGSWPLVDGDPRVVGSRSARLRALSRTRR